MSTKLLIIVPYPVPVPPFSGGQRAIYFPLLELSKLNTVYTYTLKQNTFPFVAYNYNEMSNGKGRYVNLLIGIRLLKIIKKHSIEIVQFEHPYFAWLMLFLKIFSSVKISLQTHNVEYLRFKQMGKAWWPILKAYEKMAFRCADVVYYKTDEDKALACTVFGDCRKNGTVIHYGVDMAEMPTDNYFKNAEFVVREENKLSDEKIILFNGSLSYRPNELAVEQIVEKINPVLQQSLSNYKILICGKGLRNELVEKINAIDEIIYTGFVKDIDVYFAACDVFINPVVEGGGVKTKLIEALGFGKESITYFSGSFGAEPQATGGRLHIVEDYNAEKFAEAMIQSLSNPVEDSNAAFYETYNWAKIAAKISAVYKDL